MHARRSTRNTRAAVALLGALLMGGCVYEPYGPSYGYAAGYGYAPAELAEPPVVWGGGWGGRGDWHRSDWHSRDRHDGGWHYDDERHGGGGRWVEHHAGGDRGRDWWR